MTTQVCELIQPKQTCLLLLWVLAGCISYLTVWLQEPFHLKAEQNQVAFCEEKSTVTPLPNDVYQIKLIVG